VLKYRLLNAAGKIDLTATASGGGSRGRSCSCSSNCTNGCGGITERVG
jgi:hypothetical protein